MPTHQGKSQTDIVISDGGSSAAEHTEFEFYSTYSGTGSLRYVDLAPGSDRQYSAYELIITDPTSGATVATWAARYKAWIDRGSATGKKTIDITNEFSPAPSTGSPNWPLSYQTSANRVWSVDTFDSTSNLFARAWASWTVRTTVGTPTAYVVQTIVDQTDTLLRVHLVFLDGAVVLLDTIVTMPSYVMTIGSVTQDPPDITDTFVP